MLFQTFSIKNRTGLLRSGLLCFVLISTSLFGNLSHAALSEEQKKKFEEVKRNIEKIKSELEKTKGSRDQLQDTLQKNEQDIRKLNNKTQNLKDKLEQKQSHLEQLQGEQEQLQKKKSQQAKLVKEHINAAYRLGQHSQIRLLLNQQDPTKVARMLHYYEAISESRSEKIELFSQTLQRLNKIEPEIAYETEQLKTTYSALQAERKALRHSQDTRKQTLAKLETELKDQSQRLAALQADRQRLERLLTEVFDEINAQELALDISEFSALKGKLPWPAEGKPKNRFGRKRKGSQMTWQGIEIGAARGSDVVAVHHGQVVFSDYLRGHGLLMIIDHGSGYMSLYAHNENLYKELGEWVEAGERISSVGDTGGKRDAALYFELRHNGKPTNPTPWLRRV